MTSDNTRNTLPEPIAISCAGRDLDALLADEWLLANQIGSYASQTVVGCNTRRYHGLLVAATKPPVGRVMALSQLHEQLVLDGKTHELSTFEFADTIHPRGDTCCREFVNDIAARTVFRLGEATLTKEIILAESSNAVAVRYTLCGSAGELRIRPLAALRDFHHLRMADEANTLTFELTEEGVVLNEETRTGGPLYMSAKGSAFEPGAQWWYHFHYRMDASRGQDCEEDLYSPGCFVLKLSDGEPVQFTASLGDPRQIDFDDTVSQRRGRLEQFAGGLGESADESSRRLAAAGASFVVRRHFPNLPPSWTILAGFHWFADWGRDTFIALPGLLLNTGRFDQARQVFQTFAENISEGMVPNRFDDYSTLAHYNSMDASLWFVIACERYIEATGDEAFFRRTLLPAISQILEHYQSGTRFDIHADGDGLLMGGSYNTQLTWMDAKLGDEAITPRHGKCVEINALWHSAHRILADRCREIDPDIAAQADARARIIAGAFNDAFWNADSSCLHDCLPDGSTDATIRPNQIFAVSLPHSPLTPERQQAVVDVVRQRLLTPMGLRTIDPADLRYRGQYGGSWEARDRAYHQGTAWAWLMGPFIEAYLKTQEFRPAAIAQARNWLDGFDDHLRSAGLGFISEIFDGDKPHAPHGCVAQAWSVGEVLRARCLANRKG